MNSKKIILSDALTLVAVVVLILNDVFVGIDLLGNYVGNGALLIILALGIGWLVSHRKTVSRWRIRCILMTILAGYVAISALKRIVRYQANEIRIGRIQDERKMNERMGEIDRWFDEQMKKASHLEEPEQAIQINKIRDEYNRLIKEFEHSNNMVDHDRSK